MSRTDGRGRIYVVEPVGAIEDDPNLTNKRFPGNPTKSYRSREMRDHLEQLTQQGIEAIED